MLGHPAKAHRGAPGHPGRPPRRPDGEPCCRLPSATSGGPGPGRPHGSSPCRAGACFPRPCGRAPARQHLGHSPPPPSGTPRPRNAAGFARPGLPRRRLRFLFTRPPVPGAAHGRVLPAGPSRHQEGTGRNHVPGRDCGDRRHPSEARLHSGPRGRRPTPARPRPLTRRGRCAETRSAAASAAGGW